MRVIRNGTAVVFVVVVFGFFTGATRCVALMGNCDAVFAFSNPSSQEQATEACNADLPNCGEYCFEDNDPPSINGETCDDFVWTLESNNWCDEWGYGDLDGYIGYHTVLTCSCYWDLPAQR
jgi:hypothetical protein